MALHQESRNNVTHYDLITKHAGKSEQEQRMMSELEKTKLMLAETQRIAHIGSWHWEIAEEKLYWSDESYRLLEMEPSNNPVRPDLHLKLISPGDLQRVSEAWHRALDNHETFDEIYRIKAQNGAIKYIHLLGQAGYDESGEPVYMTGTIQDITERTLAEQEINRARRSLEEARRIAHIGSWEWDIETDEIIWSDETYLLLGYEPGSVAMRRGLYFECMAPDDVNRVQEALQRTIRYAEMFDAEFKIIRPGGEIRYIHSQAGVQTKGHGRTVRIIGTMHDITERKLAEQAATRHLEFLRVVSSLSRGFINMPLDKIDGALVETLKTISEYCGACRASVWKYDWSKRVAERQYLWTRNPNHGWDSDILPFDDIPEVLANHAVGKSYQVYNVIECEADDRFASVLNKRKIISLCTFPIMESGQPFGALAISTDVAAKIFAEEELSAISFFSVMILNVLNRKEQEAELQRLHHSNRLILDSTSDGVAMYDRDGTVLNINNNLAARFHKTPEEIIGTNLTKSQYGGIGEQRLAMIRTVYDSGQDMMCEDSGTERLYLNRYCPVYKDTAVTGVSLFSTDITSRRRAEEEARKRAETEARLTLMTEFFTNISHEFKTPLTIILNSIEMVEMRFRNVEFQHKERISKNLSVMRQNSHRLLRLVANLLDITRIDAGFLHVYPQEIDISNWMERLIGSVEDYTTQRRIKVSLEDECNIQTIAIDGDKLDRIMLNLLSNAVKHTGRGGHIHVTLTDTVDKLLITVQDDGEGIPTEKQNQIFDRFRQVDTSMTRATEGSGIGLALTKALVELLHGTICFRSNPGEGTTFYLEFPVLFCEEPHKFIAKDGITLNRKVEMEFSDII